ncbi:MAG: ATP-binding cassette domain-containing protein [Acetatifactor sp.]|nr:ATP-binding cassette domain-containing protein [Acetatifactor sp.]
MTMSLYVDIEKAFGAFHLKVAFETADEVFAILGASGCGKSLTLKCIAGIERPDRGVIRLDGRTLFDSEKRIDIPARKRKIGYLFQDYALFPNMTVFENILCGAGDKELARELAARFYLEGKEQLYPAQLSGGQKQRVALARMLAAKPDYLLLDEPFSALDNYLKSKLERELMEVLDDYGRRVLFVSHDRNEVYRLTDRIAVMENGEVADIRPKRELFEAPRTLAATLLTGCKNVTRLEHREDGLYALDWGIYLRPAGTDGLSGVAYQYAAVRAHYFEALTETLEMPETLEPPEMSNMLMCEILREIEDTFSMVVLFRNRYGEQTGDYSILTAEFSKEEWAGIRARTVLQNRPLWLRIPEQKIILMER